jgi:hypothetical protein
MSNQSGVQAAVRAVTGTTLDYNGDWSALFDADGIAAGDWNGRMLAWINTTLGTSYTNLPGAMHAFAVDQGFTSWSAMNTFELFTPADLFAGGYVGDWWTATDLTKLSQDDAGLTPVASNNNPVGRWLGSVNSTALTQSSATLKPLYKTDGYVQTDGIDDFMSSTLSITTYPMTIAFVFDATVTVTGSGLGMTLSMAQNDSNYRGVCIVPATAGIAASRGVANVLTTPGKTTVTTGTRRSVWGLFESGALTFFFSEGDTGTNTHSNTHGASTLFFGKTRPSGLFAGLKVRELLIINRLLDATQRGQLRDYWGAA